MSSSDDHNLLIFGASARAAAFSALRTGLRPWCADLFADLDLQARCPVIRLPSRGYPAAFEQLVSSDLRGSWTYTGALENHRSLVDRMARRRALWGNCGIALQYARLPWTWSQLLRRAGLAVPPLRWRSNARPRQGRWLLKPIASAGGHGIHFCTDKARADSPMGQASGFLNELSDAAKYALSVLRAGGLLEYMQEYVEGVPCAAVYVADGRRARLLGVTRQLVGTPWLHAGAFRYCGSIGPTPPQDVLLQAFERTGTVLAAGCCLRGLFGVDCILRDGVPWPVEVNPRYTASVEVLEYGAGVPAMALHRAAFEPGAPVAKPEAAGQGLVGKAILFARGDLIFPDDGPWMATLHSPGPVEEMPNFADIPHAGEPIKARQPVLSFFTRASTETACLDSLKAIAAELDRWLFRR